VRVAVDVLGVQAHHVEQFLHLLLGCPDDDLGWISKASRRCR
jgi:hypothetical protein